jgi:hypothetical protein
LNPDQIQRFRKQRYEKCRAFPQKLSNDALRGAFFRFNGLLLSETALAKDWNTPEEDAAWASL